MERTNKEMKNIGEIEPGTVFCYRGRLFVSIIPKRSGFNARGAVDNLYYRFPVETNVQLITGY